MKLVLACAALMLALPAHAQINANTASPADLAKVKELGAPLQAQLLAKRPFASASAFDAVVGAGLSSEQKATLYAKVFVPFDLNKATRAEMMLVPGMTRRMAAEIEAHRPYASLAQFTAEIAKAATPAEAARLRGYVMLKP